MNKTVSARTDQLVQKEQNLSSPNQKTGHQVKASHKLTPIKFGLVSDPPAIIVKYRLEGQLKNFHHRVLLEGFVDPLSSQRKLNQEQVAEYLVKHHQMYFSETVISMRQLQSLIRKLQRKISRPANYPEVIAPSVETKNLDKINIEPSKLHLQEEVKIKPDSDAQVKITMSRTVSENLRSNLSNDSFSLGQNSQIGQQDVKKDPKQKAFEKEENIKDEFDDFSMGDLNFSDNGEVKNNSETSELNRTFRGSQQSTNQVKGKNPSVGIQDKRKNNPKTDPVDDFDDFSGGFSDFEKSVKSVDIKQQPSKAAENPESNFQKSNLPSLVKIGADKKPEQTQKAGLATKANKDESELDLGDDWGDDFGFSEGAASSKPSNKKLPAQKNNLHQLGKQIGPSKSPKNQQAPKNIKTESDDDFGGFEDFSEDSKSEAN